ncbi:MAG: hypothetical protein VX185_15555 [Pseudomonadota bacterium]|nr:hypothetical protein [Pseudomonadota bacterium]
MTIFTNGNNPNTQATQDDFDRFNIHGGGGNEQVDDAITEDELREFAKNQGLSEEQTDRLVASFGSGGEDGWDMNEFSSRFADIEQTYGEVLEEQFSFIAQGEEEMTFEQYSNYGESQGYTEEEINASWQGLNGGDEVGEDATVNLDEFKNNRSKAAEGRETGIFNHISANDESVTFADYEAYAQEQGLNEEAIQAGWKTLTGDENATDETTVDKETFGKNFGASQLKASFTQEGGENGTITRADIENWMSQNPDFEGYDEGTQQRIIEDTFHTLNGDVLEDINENDYGANYDEGKRKYESYTEFAAMDANKDGRIGKEEFLEHATEQGMSEEAANELWTQSVGEREEITLNDYLNSDPASQNSIRDTMQLGFAGIEDAESEEVIEGDREDEFNALTGGEGHEFLDRDEYLAYAESKGFEDPQGSWERINGGENPDKISKEDFMNEENEIRDLINTEFANEAVEEGQTIPEGASAILNKSDVTSEEETGEVIEGDREDEFNALTGGEGHEFLDRDEYLAYAESKGFEDPQGSWERINGGENPDKISKEDFMNEENEIRDLINTEFANEAVEEGQTIPEGASAILNKSDVTSEEETGAVNEEQRQEEFNALTGGEDHEFLDRGEYLAYAEQKGFEDPQGSWERINGGENPDKITKEDFMNPDNEIRDLINTEFANEAAEEGQTLEEGASAILTKQDSEPETDGINEEQRQEEFNALTGGENHEFLDRDEYLAYAEQKGFEDPQGSWERINGGENPDKITKEDFMNPDNEIRDLINTEFANEAAEEGQTLEEGASAILTKQDSDPEDSELTSGAKQHAREIEMNWHHWTGGDGVLDKADINSVLSDPNASDAAKEAARFLKDNLGEITQDDEKIGTSEITQFLNDNDATGWRDDLSNADKANQADSYWDSWNGDSTTLTREDLENIRDDNSRTESEREAAKWVLENSATGDELWGDDDKASVDNWTSWRDVAVKYSDVASDDSKKGTHGAEIEMNWREWAGDDGIVSQEDLDEVIFGDDYSDAAKEAAYYMKSHLGDITSDDNLIGTGEMNNWLESNNMTRWNDDLSDADKSKIIDSHWDAWNGDSTLLTRDNLEDIANDDRRSNSERSAAQWLLDNSRTGDSLWGDDDKASVDNWTSWRDSM